ncbi:alpha/beta hydrolase family esterase [Thermomonospora umbrina]|uniref:Poly(3-hydroxybutyrate) depolymerase n=1 Tax=Thermomonospora umbrina TaxID=111806 RepID=A0A3D9SSI2_9ACTN|nr:PHB depolymerase family esterase [Thermomonospora umbrina]REE95925.1 poly(3-hydroxybutyrate) depolymerase [Thermomonospora umbrina]
MSVARLMSAVALCAAMIATVVAPMASAQATTARPATTQVAACTLTPTNGTVPRTVGGRQYLVNVPSGLTGQVPLLLALHGGGEGGANHETNSGWTQFAAQKKFIVAYPTGSEMNYPPSWKLGQDSADVDHLRDVVDDIAATWCVNPARVHAAGFSNGGQMAARLACDESDKFASVATHAGPLMTLDCLPLPRKIAVGVSVGVNDPLKWAMEGQRAAWVQNNECPGTQYPETGTGVSEAYHFNCPDNTQVYWRLYSGLDHKFPVGDQGIDLRNRMWTLFEDHPLP